MLRVHRRGCVDVIGVLKQQAKAPRPLVHKVQQKPVEAAKPTLPSPTAYGAQQLAETQREAAHVCAGGRGGDSGGGGGGGSGCGGRGGNPCPMATMVRCTAWMPHDSSRPPCELRVVERRSVRSSATCGNVTST